MNRDAINTENQEDLLLQLQTVLEKQVEMLKNSNFRSLEILVERADSIIAEITREQMAQQPQLKENVEYLMQLYKKLELMIEAETTSTKKQLRKVENGKMAVRAYHHKM